MNDLDLSVLRATARLARARKSVDLESIAVRANGSVEDTRAAVARLARASLLQRGSRGIALTMMGLALAVSSSRVAPAPRALAPRAPKRRAA